MTEAQPAGPTLDDLFRRTVKRRPDALALLDPPDKARVTGTAPRRLSYVQADAAVSAIARHFNQAVLPKGSIVALQMPNTVEYVLTLLGILRAGLVAAPLPLLWRQSDLMPALAKTASRAIVTFGTVDGVDHGAAALRAAAETMSIRHVCGFGALPDEIIRINDTARASNALPELPTARDAAIATFDVSADGLVPMTRNHMQVIAAGLGVFLECGMGQDTLLAAVPPSSLAGLSTGFTCWLLSGGTLALHHAFDAAVMKQQLDAENCDALTVPNALAPRLADAGLFDDARGLRRVIGLARAPEQVAVSVDWPLDSVALTDVYAFGETGLFAARRSSRGAAPIALGPFGAPRGRSGAPVVGEALLTPKGTLALRGPMVVTDRPGEAIDTGYAARRDRKTNTLVITAPPAGMMQVGGYRFRVSDLNDWSRALGDDVMLTALPDRLSSHRLAGRAADTSAARNAAADMGLGPLVEDVFRERGVKLLLDGDQGR